MTRSCRPIEQRRGDVRTGRQKDLPEQDVLSMINLNFTALILLTRALLPYVKGAAAESRCRM